MKGNLGISTLGALPNAFKISVKGYSRKEPIMHRCKCTAVLVCVVILRVVNSLAGAAEHAPFSVRYEATWESIAKHPVPKWFHDAKFGIFVVWGPYSIPAWRPGGRGYTEHFAQFMYRNPAVYNPFMKKRFGAVPPEFGYKDICRMFEGKKFDPEAWADLFEKSGAKYVVQIGEFHAGFVMWDSELTDWCATKIGPMRDIVGEVGNAVRKRGMKYGVSTHRERHYWFFAKKTFDGGEPHDAIAEEIKQDPSATELYGPFQMSDAFMEDYSRRWEEIIEKYHPDFMWLDAFASNQDWQWALWRKHCAGMIADYLNHAVERGQEVYFNNKGRKANFPISCGARSMDNMQVNEFPTLKWQNPATMSTSYAFCEQEETGDWYRTPTELIQLLCDIVSKNGNLLLTVGPKGDGTIPERQKERFLAMGEWLKINGEAIYGTKPWIMFGESEGKVVQKPKPHSVPIHEKDIRYTSKGQDVYVLSLSKPTLPLHLTAAKGMTKEDIKEISLAGSGQKIEWSVTNEGIQIDGPAELKGEHVWVFKIERQEKP